MFSFLFQLFLSPDDMDEVFATLRNEVSKKLNN